MSCISIKAFLTKDVLIKTKDDLWDTNKLGLYWCCCGTILISDSQYYACKEDWETKVKLTDRVINFSSNPFILSQLTEENYKNFLIKLKSKVEKIITNGGFKEADFQAIDWL